MKTTNFHETHQYPYENITGFHENQQFSRKTTCKEW